MNTVTATHTEWILIGLGLITIFSYLFDVLARKTRFPSVILLVLVGMGARAYTDSAGLDLPLIEQLLPALGTLGLVLIVLDGSFELTIDKEHKPLIIRAFFASFGVMLLTITALTVLFHYGFHLSVYPALVNAIPLSIISSAVAIPSSASFSRDKRDFIIYESCFSDILGIILFNQALAYTVLSAGILLDFSLEMILVIAVTLVCSFLLVKLLEIIRHKIKYFLPIAVLIILYASGKLIHVSSLVLVFFFGLFMRNSRTLFPERLQKYLSFEQVDANMKQLHLLTGESAFLIRTFFFLAFGFSIQINKLTNPWFFLYGGIIVAIIFFIRFSYLRMTTRGLIIPEVFIGPRGLINILLFLSIPAGLKSPLINQVVVLIVFILSLLVLIWGGISCRRSGTAPPSY